MNATSALVLIMVLAFSADRLTKAVLFLIAFLPVWQRFFQDPELITHRPQKIKMRNRHLFAYTAIVGAIAGSAVWWFPELRVIEMLSGPNTGNVIDTIVTTLVVMGGSDLVGRIIQISSIGDMGAAAASGDASERNKPVEISGRLILENDGAQGYVSVDPAPAPEIKEV